MFEKVTHTDYKEVATFATDRTDAQRPVDRLVIPRSELDKVEQARKDIWAFAERHNLSHGQRCELMNATTHLWHIANRKWPSAG
jgi:hypothetical protein